jgi:pyrroline-5-carboxylate reductase
MADPLLPGPLWLVGCGNMAGAILARWLEEGVDPAHVSVIRPSGREVGEGIRVTTSWPEDEVPAIVMLGMKPYQIDAVAETLAPILDPQTILVSILAGVELDSLRARFTIPRNVIRAMPNLPVRLGKGVIGLHGQAGPEARALVTGLMAVLGHAEWIDEERAFDLLTSLSGSGPAFTFRFIDALAKAGTALGLPEAQALAFSRAAVEGAAALAATGSMSLDERVRAVASRKGTTEAGLLVLDAELDDLVMRTLEAARNRELEMAAEARRT